MSRLKSSKRSMEKILCMIIALSFGNLISSIAQIESEFNIYLTGVNLAGAEFGSVPGEFEENYIYPTTEEVDYFSDKGMNVIRLPFKWERMQAELYADFDTSEYTRLTDFVEYATDSEMYVILDPHNYARYYDDVIGESNVPVEGFVDFWVKLANEYKNNPYVIFGLMNEPHTMSTELWRDNANAAIQGIRREGASNLILVPGNAWTGAHSWDHDWYGTPNAEVMTEISDSLNNYAFDIHQYLDSDFSGTDTFCQSETIGSESLETFTNWAREHGQRGFIGEFAGGDNSTCSAALNDMLTFMEDNQDVWIGWSWWAAGPWWGDYYFSLEPSGGQDAPQMSVLEPFIGAEYDPTPPTSTSVEDVEKPSKMELIQNYPNPFNPTTTITYSIKNSAMVELSVHNMLGQKVVTLVNQRQSSGEYNVVFDAANLPSGIYLYRLETGNQSLIRKMLLVK